jgi:uncharacterized Zn finger protein (UPF0148 family)
MILWGNPELLKQNFAAPKQEGTPPMATPHCPYCQAASPACLALQRLDLFGTVYCKNCGNILGVISLPSLPKPAGQRIERPQSDPPKADFGAKSVTDSTEEISRPQSVLDVVGNADLSSKTPYDPVLIANRMKAANISQGSRYLQVVVDDGPPFCPHHKTEMVKVTIPDGYKNAGREIWLCGQFNTCQQWELAK